MDHAKRLFRTLIDHLARPAGAHGRPTSTQATWLEALEPRVMLSSALPTLDALQAPVAAATDVATLIATPTARVKGRGHAIIDGSTTPKPGNGTSFGSVIQAARQIKETFTIVDVGHAALTVGTPAVPAGFVLLKTPAASLAPGRWTTFTIALTTATPGVFSGAVSVPTNDPASNPYTFAITGTVTTPSSTVKITARGHAVTNGSTTPQKSNATDFGSAKQGGRTLVATFVITNQGNATLTLGTPSLPAGFSLVTAPASSVKPGHRSSFAVALPTFAAGVFSGAVSLLTNDPNNTLYVFAITGSVSGVLRLAPQNVTIQVAGGGAVPFMQGVPLDALLHADVQGSTPVAQWEVVWDGGGGTSPASGAQVDAPTPSAGGLVPYAYSTPGDKVIFARATYELAGGKTFWSAWARLEITVVPAAGAYYASNTWAADPNHAYDSPYDAFNTTNPLNDWNSGLGPTQWIEVDLGATYDLTGIDLWPNVSPSGDTHVDSIYVSQTPIENDHSNATLAASLSFTADSDIEHDTTFANVVQGRYVQILTTSTPSWVAWSQIQVLGYAPDGDPTPVNLSAGLAPPDTSNPPSPPIAPAAPANVTAITLTASSVQLYWVTQSSNATAFNIQWSTDPNFGSGPTISGGTLTTPDASDSTCIITGLPTLPAGVPRYFRVSAVNATGDSPYSDVVSQTVTDV